MNRSSDLWVSPEIEFSQAQQTLSVKLRDWMRKRNGAFAPQLADFKTEDFPLTCTPKEMQYLQKNIQIEFESGKAAYAALVVLGKFVAYVNRIGKGPIPQPRIFRLVTKSSNPFRDGIAEHLACVRIWLDMERKWIDECAVSPPVELVILSAILHGGLLHPGSVANFTRALLATSGQAYGCIGSRVYVDLAQAGRGEPEMEDRRWYPDDQTAALIRRPEQYARRSDWEPMDELTNDQVLRLLFQKIRQRMRSGHMRKNALPASLKQLIDTVATAARIDVPAVLVEYATHGIVSHSLKFDTLQRIHGAAAKADTQAELLEQKDDAAIDAQEMITANSNPDDLEPEWLQQLRASLRTKDASQAVAALEALLATFPSPACPGHRITDFAHYLLTERHQDQRRFVARKRLAISTVQSWTLTVARRFGRILGDQDPVALTTENIETLYTQVLENVVEGDDSRRLGRTVAQALREFQEFLVGKLEVAPIHDREILGSSGGLLPVDAKILTLEQYSEARRSIRQKSHHEYDAKLLHATEALLIFGFRFGTRRMEAYGLELPDLAGEPTAWLLVRPTEGRQLKTDNAKRQLPLRSLIPEDELEVLDSWKQARIQNRTDGRPNECLSFFAAPQLNENGVVVQTPFPVRKMITLLHEAIRNATGDNTLHFHHLRHSFATWTFLRLMISDLPRIPDLFPHLPETTAWLREAKDFREQLYGTPHPTRKHAMAVASLLGHSGPGVSLEHYIHCLDWLLPLFLAESPLLRVPSVNRVAIASAYPKSNLNNWNQYLGSSSLSGQIFKKRFPGLAATPNANSAHVASPGPIDSGSQRWLWNTWNLLFLEGTTREPLDELADRLGFDLETAELILARAKAIQQIREPEGRKSVRHEMETVAVDRRNPGEKIVIACPKRCNDQGTQEVIEGIEPKLWTMANRPDVDSVQRVLGYFVQNSWLTLNVLPFRNPDQPEDAILYRKFLSDLDIPDSRIRFVSFDQRKRSRSRRKWKNAFKTDKALQEKIRIQKPPFVASSASDRWLGIEPDSARNGPAQKQHGLVGFRFLLVMAAIRFGYAGEEQ